MNTSSPSSPLVTKRRVAWAGVAAVVGCAACCAAPLLAVMGLGSGAAATITGLMRPGMELLVGFGVFALVLGGTALLHRNRRTTAGACSVDGSCATNPRSTCGCGPAA